MLNDENGKIIEEAEWESVHIFLNSINEKLADIEVLNQIEDEEIKNKEFIGKVQEIQEILLLMNNDLNILYSFYLKRLEEIQIMKEFKKV